MSEYLDKAFSPAQLGKLPLKNRIIKAATYEGKSPDGIPGDNLLQFHKDIVAGGVAMTTTRRPMASIVRLMNPQPEGSTPCYQH
jgi:2,4-dienoyl-CoA reductase-like NADH-dependent reductase (Old Yellow Enzyme family)